MTNLTSIAPDRRYAVTMHRPVRYRLVTYRPCDRHVMTGAVILALLEQEGVPEAAMEALLSAELIEG